MVPTLGGRLQTRVFAVLVIGGLWTLVVTPMLSAAYGATYRVLAAVAVLGLGWELLYHLAQQFRWEKDWPTFFGLVTAVNEGALLWLLLANHAIPGTGAVGATVFLLDFGSVWVAVWLFLNGPMRAASVHWRFRGGRLLGR